MPSAREIRARAREALGFRIFGSGWMYGVLACGLVSIISSLIGNIPFVGMIITLIVTGPLTMGLANYFRHVGERTLESHASMEPLFEPLKNDLGDSIVLGLLNFVFVFLWSLLLFIPGIIKSYSYSMAYYIKLDHPEYTPNQAITESRRMMNGHKFRLFCLDFSFFGWMFLGVLLCGVGIFWVQPYMEASRYEFYRDLRFTETGDFGTDFYSDFTPNRG